MLRPLNHPGGSARADHFPRKEAVRRWRERVGFFWGNETAPDDRATLQGEIRRAPGGLQFFGSERSRAGYGRMIRMRDALRVARSYQGLTVLFLLRKHLSPPSLDDLMELLDLYPEAVIEFSAYDLQLGTCRGRNTIIWEVRNY